MFLFFILAHPLFALCIGNMAFGYILFLQLGCQRISLLLTTTTKNASIKAPIIASLVAISWKDGLGW